MVVVWCRPLSLHPLYWWSLAAAALLGDIRHLVVVVDLLCFFGDNSRFIRWLWTGYNKFEVVLLSTIINSTKLSFAAVVSAQSLHVECSSSISLIFICHYDHTNTLKFFGLVSLICGCNCSPARSLLLLKIRFSRI